VATERKRGDKKKEKPVCCHANWADRKRGGKGVLTEVSSVSEKHDSGLVGERGRKSWGGVRRQAGGPKNNELISLCTLE